MGYECSDAGITNRTQEKVNHLLLERLNEPKQLYNHKTIKEMFISPKDIESLGIIRSRMLFLDIFKNVFGYILIIFFKNFK